MPEPADSPGARIGLLVVCLGSLLGPLDTSVNVAFPLITSSFDLALADIQWIVVSYIVAQSGLTLAFGKLGDLYGHRRVFRFGMAGCAITHLLCSLAPTYALLVAARVAQGVAVGLAMACGPALATLLFAPSHRRRILSIYVMLLGAGIALGPLIGGVMLDWSGWPGVFWFRTPLAALVLVLTIWLPEPLVQRPEKPSFDYVGALLLTLCLASLIVLISVARRPDVAVWMLFVFVAALFASSFAFVRHEARFDQPILHIKYLGDRSFRALLFASVVINLCGFSVFLLLPYVLDGNRHLSAAWIGVMLAISPAGAVLSGLAGGSIASHWTPQRLIGYGLAISAIGLLLVSGFMALASLVPMSLGLLVCGLGIGLFQVGFMDLSTATLPVAERGVAGSLLNVTRVVGAVIGAASITWMYDVIRIAHPGLPAFQASFAVLGAGLLLFAGYYAVRFKPAR